MNSQMRVMWPPVTPGVKILIGILAGLWLLPIFVEPIRQWIVHYGVLQSDSIVGQPWTLITHGFFERDFLGMLFSGIALWLFGSELEQRWGQKKWWIVQGIALVLGGLVIAGIMWMVGADSGFSGWRTPVMALVAAYCIRLWNAQLNFFFIPMTGKTMLAFFVGLSVVMAILAQAWWMLGTDAVGVLVGYLALNNRSSLGFRVRDLKTRFRLWRARRRMKLVKGNGTAGENRGPDRPDRKHFN